MKKLLLGTVALVALGATVPALAADLTARPYTKAPAYAQPIYNWTGFYIGGDLRGRLRGPQNFTGRHRRVPGRLTGRRGSQFAPSQGGGVPPHEFRACK